MNSRFSTVAAAIPLLVATACATSLADETRVHLGGKSFIELRLPVGWEFRPVFDRQPSAKQVRVFRGATEVMQVVPLQWSNDQIEPASSWSHLRNQATTMLRERGYCQAAEIRERVLPDGLALYCAKSGGTGGSRVSGVLATARMTAAFVFLDPQVTIEPVLWQVVSTIRHFSFEHAA